MLLVRFTISYCQQNQGKYEEKNTSFSQDTSTYKCTSRLQTKQSTDNDIVDRYIVNQQTQTCICGHESFKARIRGKSDQIHIN